MTVSGGVTGNGNLTLQANTTTGNILISNALVDNTGTIVSSGSAAGTVTISGGVGSHVRSITNTGPSVLTINTLPVSVNANGTSLINNGTGAFSVANGIIGTGNVTIRANSTGTMTLGSGGINPLGTIANSGTVTGNGCAATGILLGQGNSLANSGTIATSVTLALAGGSGAATVTNSGTLNGTLALTGTGGNSLSNAGLITVGAALTFFLWVYGLAHTTPTKVTNTITLNPVTAAIVAAFLVSEPVGLHLFIGIAAVFTGILIASTDALRLPGGSASLRPWTDLFLIWRERAAEQRCLADLNDHYLKDIGLTRSDLFMAGTMTFGADPTTRLRMIVEARQDL